jgi:hypothetical protein
VRHRRIDVVPRSIIRASHKPDPVIVAEEDNLALVIATKYHPFVAWTMPNLLLGEFATMLGKCRPSGFGDGESLSGPSTFGYTRVIALHDVSGTSELVQLSLLTAAGRNGEHQKCSAMPFDALQHREERRSELQIAHKG